MIYVYEVDLILRIERQGKKVWRIKQVEEENKDEGSIKGRGRNKGSREKREKRRNTNIAKEKKSRDEELNGRRKKSKERQVWETGKNEDKFLWLNVKDIWE